MKFYQLEIRYPQQTKSDAPEHIEQLDALEIERQFDAINWHRQWVLQLELDHHDTSFTVTDQDNGQSIRLLLKSYADTQSLCFKLESDIEMIRSRAALFGLLQLKHKDYVTFERLSQQQARQYLSQFLSQQFDQLTEHYQATLPQAVKA